MNDNNLPKIIYGTAWKQEMTSTLVEMAILSGFTAIDTANQPLHYSESLVGTALLKLQNQGIYREKLFLQTKFTPPHSQDQRIPYDPRTKIEEQVEASFQSSLNHLKTSYLDSYLLHGPYSRISLIDEDWQTWRAMEKLFLSGQTKKIGISNVNIIQLKLLFQQATIKPTIVQNRCYAQLNWDQEVREFCHENQIMYQGFSLLTANTRIWEHEKITQIAQRLNRTAAQVIFRFATLIGIVPLTGTSYQKHMQQDLQIFDFDLNTDDINEIKEIAIFWG